MNLEVRRRLEYLRQDYAKNLGRPFKHFFCPILAVDEETEFQKGHIINEAFKGSSRVWEVQRCDVDSFFGSHFEADFEILQYKDCISPTDLFRDRKLNRQYRPIIHRGGTPIAYTARQSELPKVFTPVTLEDDKQAVTIGIKLSPEQLIASAGEKWEIVINKDIRLSALVSLIKSAHLTIFRLLGYRYAAFSAGLFVGHDILGRFYLENLNKSRETVQANAHSYFRDYRHMVRPVVTNGLNFKGTVTDQSLFACVGTSGQIWGLIVYVKTAHIVHAVLLPVFDKDKIDTVETFVDFLRNENEIIHVTVAKFDRKNGCWYTNLERKMIAWPKTGILYPELDI